MNELLLAINEFLVAQDIFDRQHTDTARRLKDRKRGVLNHVLVKKQRQQQAAEQAAMWAAEEAR
jgi:hypothetical protein